MKILILVLLSFTFIPASRANSSDVAELTDLIRKSSEQMEWQVQVARENISTSQWLSFNEAVVLVNNYQQLVVDALDSLHDGDVECLDSMPKPVHSILTSADWNIEMCIGHMVVYGSSNVEEAEGQLRRYEENVSGFPITAIKDFFLSDWSAADGVDAMIDVLRKRMQNWDNVHAIEIYDLKQRVGEQMKYIANKEWTLCANYGWKETKKLFEQAMEYVEDCMEKERK